jgi:hypothetical protein
MSSAHIRLSSGSEALNFSMRGSTLPVKRPPHSLGVAASSAAGAAGAAAAGAAAEGACVAACGRKQEGLGGRTGAAAATWGARVVACCCAVAARARRRTLCAAVSPAVLLCAVNTDALLHQCQLCSQGSKAAAKCTLPHCAPRQRNRRHPRRRQLLHGARSCSTARCHRNHANTLTILTTLTRWLPAPGPCRHDIWRQTSR